MGTQQEIATLRPEDLSFSLDDKYSRTAGSVLISGVQALVRAVLTRASLDKGQGLNTGGFVSGYRGSPLGGLDKELWGQETRLQAAGIKFQPGLNEDLAATAVWGSQQVGLHAGANVEGAFGLWYGKAPGLDRSCDAIRHANSWGTSAKGGVVLVVGDDPAAKSSTLASQSEITLQDMQVPVLVPSDVQDVYDFTVLAWEMSRHSGLWVGLKAIADHMDSSATIEVGEHRFSGAQLPPSADVSIRREDTPTAQEIRQSEVKLPAAIEFARKTGINKWMPPAREKNTAANKARLGIIAVGKAYRDVREALDLMGLSSQHQIAEAGIGLLKMGMAWPCDDTLMQQLACEVDTLWVVEEKRPFVEPLVKNALYGKSTTPVWGKSGPHQSRLLGDTGQLHIAEVLSGLAAITGRGLPDSFDDILVSHQNAVAAAAPARTERTPMFCAGCPHNTSTRVPENSRATAGIGCHYMVQWMDRDTDSVTHMGGEGITWVGEAPFTDEQHIFANLGDGTYFHSGILAIRQAVAAGVNITYKVLFNDAVAMTGGQQTDGELTVAGLISQVQAEGVKQVVVVTDQPEIHSELDSSVAVYHRGDLDHVQRHLREQPGVTVLVYQQTCATELRRQRKRGLVADDRPRLVINEDVCDGCGDCSVQSNCVAVEPVVTPEGIKRQINQTTCNKDLSCATGYCPAFVEVRGDLQVSATGQADWLADALQNVPAEPKVLPMAADMLLGGVGGTGIVTVSALLAAAARIDGKQVSTLDMTGLAQKGGAVFAHVRISPEAIHSAKIPVSQVDTLIGCDLVSSASSEALEMYSKATNALVNSHVTPTAEFVLRQEHNNQLDVRIQRINQVVGQLSTISAEAHVEKAFGQSQQANLFMLGTAWQKGWIPLSRQSLVRAIELNGVAVEANLQAFELGRVAAVRSDLLDLGMSAGKHDEASGMTLSEVLARAEQKLGDYGCSTAKQDFRRGVAAVRSVEQRVRPGSDELTRAAARSLLRVLTPKDEYEVARLYREGGLSTRLNSLFVKPEVTYLLAPPLLGESKRRFGAWMGAGFGALARLKRLRGTWLDPFRFTAERKLAQQIRTGYVQDLALLCENLSAQNFDTALELARYPQHVRGFGHVRQAQYKQALTRCDVLRRVMTTVAQPVRVFDPHAQPVAANQGVSSQVA